MVRYNNKKTKKKIDKNKLEKQYVWKGTENKGMKRKGMLFGKNPNEIKLHLSKKKITVISIRKKPQPLGGGKITEKELAVFTRQLSTMIASGVPLTKAFDLLADGSETLIYRNMILGIKESLDEGLSLSEGLKKYPKYFDVLFCSLIATGEESGTLDVMLAEAANYQEKLLSTKKKVKKAMTYPTVVIVFTLILTAVMLVYVVPVFKDTFDSFGAELPAFTQFIIDLSDALQKYIVYIIIFIVVFIFLFKYLNRKYRGFKRAVDTIVLKLPVFGMVIEKAQIARFARILSTTFKAGMPLSKALSSVSLAMTNLVFQDAIKRVKINVLEGNSLTESMNYEEKLPILLSQMAGVGEESGNLEDMLQSIAVTYEEDVDLIVDSLSSILEPIIMVVLGVVVGGIVVAIYLPIFHLGDVVG